MDFTPIEARAGARDLAARIFGDLAGPDRLKAAGTGSDPELWKALCAAGLVGAVTDPGLLGLPYATHALTAAWWASEAGLGSVVPRAGNWTVIWAAGPKCSRNWGS